MKSIEEFAALVERAERAAERLEALDKGGAVKALTTEVQAQSAAIADILEAVASQGAEAQAMLSKALAGLSIKGGDIRPQINVAVPEIKLPAMPQASSPKRIVIEPERAPNGQPKRYILSIE